MLVHATNGWFWAQTVEESACCAVLGTLAAGDVPIRFAASARALTAPATAVCRTKKLKNNQRQLKRDKD